MKEKIIDILEKHYHGRNFIESRCADELFRLLKQPNPCQEENEWFDAYLKDYVKQASTVDLFEKLKNVTKPEYHPIVEEIHSRYGNQIMKSITLRND